MTENEQGKLTPNSAMGQTPTAMITDSAKSEAEKFLDEKCGPNGSHAVLAYECTRLRAENEKLKKQLSILQNAVRLLRIMAEHAEAVQ